MRPLTIAALAVLLAGVGCPQEGPPPTPFFAVDLSWTLESADGKPGTCASLHVANVKLSLVTSTTNVPFATTVGPCETGVSSEGGTRDAGSVGGFLRATGYGGESYDVYLQGFDASGRYVAFGKALSFVPPSVPDGSTLTGAVTMRVPKIAGCGDGAPGEPGKQCDDCSFDNNCCNCLKASGLCP